MEKNAKYLTRIIFPFFLSILIFTASCSKSPVETTDLPQNDFTANNLSITEIIVGNSNTTGKYRMITFDLTWDNWQTSSAVDNWDAVWVFIKFKVANGDWQHATLSTIPTEHTSLSGATVTSTSDGKGVFIKDGGNGTGLLNAADISLRWNYGLNNVADDADVSIRVFGLEMVYIPEGSFYAGDNGHSYATLTKGSNDNRPWFITNEDAIEVTNTVSDGYYYNSSKDYWNDRWNAIEDVTGTEFTLPADFPKGYRAIYCMKYEMSQQQYVDFLNTLNGIQSANRYDISNYNDYGYTILENNGVFSTDNPNRACGFLSTADGLAFTDWAALRPMSELEFEKICRGSGNQPVNGEYAWGSTTCQNAVSVNGTEDDRDQVTISGANSYYSEDNYAPQFPLNIGIFAGSGKSRELSGAAYYGVMDMCGNLNETCISIGNSYGRAITYHNGNGQLASDGFTDENNWPLRDGKGAGYKGGNFAREAHEMRISERNDATVEMDWDHRHIPLGFGGVRTVLF